MLVNIVEKTPNLASISWCISVIITCFGLIRCCTYYDLQNNDQRRASSAFVGAKSISSPVWLDQNESLNCERINWLHVPKTSSMFCLSIKHACCKSQYERLTNGVTIEMVSTPSYSYKFISNHCYDFRREGYDQLNCRFAGVTHHKPIKVYWNNPHELIILREPMSRLVSAFLDGQHHEGFLGNTYLELRDKWVQALVGKNYDAVNTTLVKFRVYSGHPNMKGCQVKMLLGYECFSPFKIPSNFLEICTRRLKHFFFVGIFEEYEKSIRLFHALSNKNTTPDAVELSRQRSTNKVISGTKVNAKQLLLEDLSTWYEDPYDTALYEKGKEIFAEEIAFVRQYHKDIVI